MNMPFLLVWSWGRSLSEGVSLIHCFPGLSDKILFQPNAGNNFFFFF